jgi:hypothetical protein
VSFLLLLVLVLLVFLLLLVLVRLVLRVHPRVVLGVLGRHLHSVRLGRRSLRERVMNDSVVRSLSPGGRRRGGRRGRRREELRPGFSSRVTRNHLVDERGVFLRDDVP